jgi:hypothetical protein
MTQQNFAVNYTNTNRRIEQRRNVGRNDVSRNVDKRIDYLTIEHDISVKHNLSVKYNVEVEHDNSVALNKSAGGKLQRSYYF